MALDKPEDYQAYGVAPPTVEGHGFTDTPENPLSAQLNAMGGHRHSWHQKGNDVFCDRGPHLHGNHVPTDHILLGTDPNGEPIYRIVDIRIKD